MGRSQGQEGSSRRCLSQCSWQQVACLTVCFALACSCQGLSIATIQPQFVQTGAPRIEVVLENNGVPEEPGCLALCKFSPTVELDLAAYFSPATVNHQQTLCSLPRSMTSKADLLQVEVVCRPERPGQQGRTLSSQPQTLTVFSSLEVVQIQKSTQQCGPENCLVGIELATDIESYRPDFQSMQLWSVTCDKQEWTLHHVSTQQAGSLLLNFVVTGHEPQGYDYSCKLGMASSIIREVMLYSNLPGDWPSEGGDDDAASLVNQGASKLYEFLQTVSNDLFSLRNSDPADGSLETPVDDATESVTESEESLSSAVDALGLELKRKYQLIDQQRKAFLMQQKPVIMFGHRELQVDEQLPASPSPPTPLPTAAFPPPPYYGNPVPSPPYYGGYSQPPPSYGGYFSPPPSYGGYSQPPPSYGGYFRPPPPSYGTYSQPPPPSYGTYTPNSPPSPSNSLPIPAEPGTSSFPPGQPIFSPPSPPSAPNTPPSPPPTPTPPPAPPSPPSPPSPPPAPPSPPSPPPVPPQPPSPPPPFPIFAPGTPVKTMSGQAYDGYLVNCIAYFDSNDNAKLDNGEFSGPIRFLGTSGFQIDVPEGLAPAPIRVLPATNLTERSVTGTDSDECYDGVTWLKLTVQLAAPAGSSVISPLSTLLLEMERQGLSESQAQDKIRSLFNLPSNITVGSSDVFDLLLRKNDSSAFAVLRAEQAVMNLMVGQSSFLAKNDSDIADVSNSVVSSLSSYLISKDSVDLASLDDQVAVLAGSLQRAVAVKPAAVNTAAASDGDKFALAALALANQQISQNSKQTIITLLESSSVGQGLVYDQLRTMAAPDGNISPFINATSITALNAAAANTTLPGSLLPPGDNQQAGTNPPPPAGSPGGDDGDRSFKDRNRGGFLALVIVLPTVAVLLALASVVYAVRRKQRREAVTVNLGSERGESYYLGSDAPTVATAGGSRPSAGSRYGNTLRGATSDYDGPARRTGLAHNV